MDHMYPGTEMAKLVKNGVGKEEFTTQTSDEKHPQLSISPEQTPRAELCLLCRNSGIIRRKTSTVHLSAAPWCLSWVLVWSVHAAAVTHELSKHSLPQGWTLLPRLSCQLFEGDKRSPARPGQIGTSPPPRRFTYVFLK